MRKTKEASIILPENPFWEVFKRFGRDEFIALVINILGTVILAAILSASSVPIETKVLLLAFVGPVIEKIGFYPGHFWEARKTFNSIPLKRRKPFKFYRKRAIKRGTKSLIQDILIHDPVYIILMYVGLNMYAGTPEWILAFLSFIIAVVIVSFIEVGMNELLYRGLIARMKLRGFDKESYYEARFKIDTSRKPEDVIKIFSEEFNLPNINKHSYVDYYYQTKLPMFSGRTPKLRLRKRCNKKHDGFIQTAQLVYTRAGEWSKNALSQYRYFPLRKDKMYAFLDQDMPQNIDEIKDEKVKRFFAKNIELETHTTVKFDRWVAFNSATILMSVDYIENGEENPHYLVELKTYHDKALLKEAMRYMMDEFTVVQTTKDKYNIINE